MMNTLKPMGFRNSGKFGFGGRGGDFALIAAIGVVIVLALILVGSQMCNGRGNPLDSPDKYQVKCTKCIAEWVIGRDELSKYQDREVRDESGRNIGGDCPKCKANGAVFVMVKCPECEKYYLSKRVTDPEGIATGKVKDTCPHCGTDMVEWYKKRHKKR